MIEWINNNISALADWLTVAGWTFSLGKSALRLILEILQSKRQTKKRKLK